MTWRTHKKGETGRVIHDRLLFLLPQRGILLSFTFDRVHVVEGMLRGWQGTAVAFFQGTQKKKNLFGKETNRGLWREQVLGLQGLFRESNSRVILNYIPLAAKKENIGEGLNKKL